MMHNLSIDKNVYPAPPVLASTLLELESDHKRNAETSEPFQTGIKRLDDNLPPTLWTGGKVIGIASDRGESTLAQHLIATHLSNLAPSLSCGECNATSTFIIAPPNTSTASNINNVLSRRLTAGSEAARIQLLDTVQLMPYFDFVGLSDSFSEVSSCLHDLKGGIGKDSSQAKRHILFVDGLCPVLESTQRRSGSVQVNALAASFLRSVTHISRSHPSLLVLLSLETSRDTLSGEEVTSAFSSPGKSLCGANLGTMLQRTLLAGIDTVVLLYDTADAGLKSGDLIVEVVKDRVDVSFGQWAVWPRSF